MRKRNIKSVAHWVIMSFLLLFPVLMVGISAFANNEQSVTVTETTEYQTNEVSSNDDLIVGHIYKLNYDFDNDIEFDFFSEVAYLYDLTNNTKLFVNDLNFYHYVDEALEYNFTFLGTNFGGSISNDSNFSIYFVLGTYADEILNYQVVIASDYLGQVTTNVDIQNASYKQEVNNWANGFKNLPVNQWYGSLLNTIGVGQTDNSVMNVIYVYPLYVLWVYILDVIVDCFLVIINFGHNALHRLGGDNE